MDSIPESEFDSEKKSTREIDPLPKPARPRVVLPDANDSQVDPPVDLNAPGIVPPFPGAEVVREERISVSKVVHESILDPSRPVHSQVRRSGSQYSQDARPSGVVESRGLGGLYFLLASAALMFGIWFIGPRLVEEYHYAATLGKARAEYENAVVHLDKQPLANVSLAYQLVAQRIRPSVVCVNAIRANRDGRPDGSGLGSGVIMSSDGYILTNAHVLKDAVSVRIQLHDRREFTASLVGSDIISDLALLKIDATDLTPATWGESEAINVGSIVWAIGSPYGFQQTVTSGIISGKDRKGDQYHPKQSLIQTDAAVNPGNSGGPLVDSQGRVIGINTSIYGDTFQGISFAVPSETAKFVYQQLIQDGKVTRGYLGVIPMQVNHRDAIRLGLPDLDGAKMKSVQYGSPAHLAGIRRWDVIRSWNGVDVKDFKHLFRLAEMTTPDTRVEVSWISNGQEHSADITVGTLPDMQSWTQPVGSEPPR